MNKCDSNSLLKCFFNFSSQKFHVMLTYFWTTRFIYSFNIFYFYIFDNLIKKKEEYSSYLKNEDSLTPKDKMINFYIFGENIT